MTTSFINHLNQYIQSCSLWVWEIQSSAEVSQGVFKPSASPPPKYHTIQHYNERSIFLPGTVQPQLTDKGLNLAPSSPFPLEKPVLQTAAESGSGVFPEPTAKIPSMPNRCRKDWLSPSAKWHLGQHTGTGQREGALCTSIQSEKWKQFPATAGTTDNGFHSSSYLDG